jgi:hypothetical protein
MENILDRDGHRGCGVAPMAWQPPQGWSIRAKSAGCQKSIGFS